MPTSLLTIFTPTYNRAHTLPRLLESLKNQTCKDFEWLVIDDGSTDDTQRLFREWLEYDYGFNIRYEKTGNGGKNRAINKGIRYAEGRYFMILDSDDMLASDAVEFICKNMPDIESNESFIGMSGKKADMATGLPIGLNDKSYSEKGYIDCTNLERDRYNLCHDMAEVFITERLRKYEFEVWPSEKFTPEEVVWNQMALDGYKLRWYNKITYLCEYQPGGLSDSSWRLLRDNPMGYAMMWNQKLIIDCSILRLIKNSIQYSTCCLIAGEPRMIKKSNYPILACILMPIAWLLYQRRKLQFEQML